MFQDIRYGIRMLLKKPGFTAVAVLSLALGIGANTAIFSLLDAVLLKTLPVDRPDQLVLFGKAESMGMTTGFPDGSTDLYSYPFYQQVQQQRTDMFSGVASFLSMPWNVHGFVNSSSDIEQLQVQLVSGSYFPVLGVNAGLGRVLTETDDQTAGAHPVAVVSYAWWQLRLGANPAAVGQTISIDNTAYTIVGVAPREFFGTTVGSAPDLWIPLAMEKQMPPAHWDGRTNENWQDLYLIGRLKPGVTAQQANAAVNLQFTQSLQARAGAQPALDRARPRRGGGGPERGPRPLRGRALRQGLRHARRLLLDGARARSRRDPPRAPSGRSARPRVLPVRGRDGRRHPLSGGARGASPRGGGVHRSSRRTARRRAADARLAARSSIMTASLDAARRDAGGAIR